MNRKILFALFVLIAASLGAGYWGTKRAARQAEEGVCIQVITPAKNTKTGEVKDFPTPCDVPEGWEIVDTSTTGIPLLLGNNAIYVPDQKPGKTITVHTAVFGEKGFVVIHQDAAGKPGTILGSSRLLGTGSSEAIEITLSRESKNGEALYAMLHADDGDGKFDANKDKPILDDDGNQVMMRFVIDVNALPPFDSKL